MLGGRLSSGFRCAAMIRHAAPVRPGQPRTPIPVKECRPEPAGKPQDRPGDLQRGRARRRHSDPRPRRRRRRLVSRGRQSRRTVVGAANRQNRSRELLPRSCRQHRDHRVHPAQLRRRTRRCPPARPMDVPVDHHRPASVNDHAPLLAHPRRQDRALPRQRRHRADSPGPDPGPDAGPEFITPDPAPGSGVAPATTTHPHRPNPAESVQSRACPARK